MHPFFDFNLSAGHCLSDFLVPPVSGNLNGLEACGRRKPANLITHGRNRFLEPGWIGEAGHIESDNQAAIPFLRDLLSSSSWIYLILRAGGSPLNQFYCSLAAVDANSIAHMDDIENILLEISDERYLQNCRGDCRPGIQLGEHQPGRSKAGHLGRMKKYRPAIGSFAPIEDQNAAPDAHALEGMAGFHHLAGMNVDPTPTGDCPSADQSRSFGDSAQSPPAVQI